MREPGLPCEGFEPSHGNGLYSALNGLLVVLAFDEGFNLFTADIIPKLSGRSLEEIRRGSNDRTGKAAVEGQFGAADSINDHAGRVGAVPYFQFQFQIERHIAEGGALHADIAPLAVGQPRHMVRGANVDVIGVHRVRDHAGDRAGLGDLLGLKALALQHIQEVRVAAEVELVGAVNAHTAVDEQAGEDAVQDGRANLGLDVVAQDGQTGILEAFAPVLGRGNEDRDAVAYANDRHAAFLFTYNFSL